VATKTKPEPTKSTRGGARPGSGRPRKTALQKLISNVLIEDLEKLAREDLMPAITELVRGVQIAQRDQKGNERIYQQAPNSQMCIYVMDRILGKVTEKHELSGELTLSLKSLAEIKHRAGN